MTKGEYDRDGIREETRGYILSEFLPGESPSALEDSTPLITGGILDSIANAKLVTFLEERFDIRFRPNEVNAQNLDTIERIVDTVEAKRKG